MKNLLIFTIGFLGIINPKKVLAATYTHNLSYTHNDNDQNSTLTGRVTFETTDPNAQDTAWPNGTTFDTGFITDLTFTYTKNGVIKTVNYSDFTPADGAEYRINHDGSVDYNVANLKAELTDIAFQTDLSGSFLMTPNLQIFQLILMLSMILHWMKLLITAPVLYQY